MAQYEVSKDDDHKRNRLPTWFSVQIFSLLICHLMILPPAVKYVRDGEVFHARCHD